MQHNVHKNKRNVQLKYRSQMSNKWRNKKTRKKKPHQFVEQKS